MSGLYLWVTEDSLRVESTSKLFLIDDEELTYLPTNSHFSSIVGCPWWHASVVKNVLRQRVRGACSRKFTGTGMLILGVNGLGINSICPQKIRNRRQEIEKQEGAEEGAMNEKYLLGRAEILMARVVCQGMEVGIPLKQLEKSVIHLPFIFIAFRF